VFAEGAQADLQYGSQTIKTFRDDQTAAQVSLLRNGIQITGATVDALRSVYHYVGALEPS
jgi:hypothetical protein